jgi:hypothetical protein
VPSASRIASAIEDGAQSFAVEPGSAPTAAGRPIGECHPILPMPAQPKPDVSARRDPEAQGLVAQS